MSEEAKVYTCSVCGKPTPNYHEWSPSMAAILGEQGSSTCDECSRKAQISYKWRNEQFDDERLVCPYCENSEGKEPDMVDDEKLVTVCHGLMNAANALEIVASIGMVVPWLLESKGSEDE